ncbi:MAG: sialate O-acetylesterase [Bacteroidota bacterium]
MRNKLSNNIYPIWTSLIGIFLLGIAPFLGAQDADLELRLAAERPTFVLFNFVSYTLEVHNKGPEPAGDIEVQFTIPEGLTFSESNESPGTSYFPWDNLWVIDKLEAGETVGLEVRCFVLNDEGPIFAFTQIQSAAADDPDSEPGNNTSELATEDDEAALLLFPLGTNGNDGTVLLEQFPENRHFVVRDLTSNTGRIQLKGIAEASSEFERIKARIFRENLLIEERFWELNYNNDQAAFDFLVDIPAELANYRIDLFGQRKQLDVLLESADELVAGDVFLINGQSNAIANGAAMPQDRSPFIRSYTDTYGWDYINFSFPGQWGGRIMKALVDEQQIPVALFNQAEGGVAIDFFVKDDNDPYSGNYGALLKRMEDAGIERAVRAAFWFQGETDGWGSPPEEYKAAFEQILEDWQADYQISNAYLYQIRFGSCLHPFPYIMEAQRQLAIENDVLQIMSTTNAAHDSCHFDYVDGYEELGNRMYHLMRKDLYGGLDENVQAPDVEQIYLSSPKEITIELKNVIGDLQVIGTPWSEFVLEGSTAIVVDGEVSGPFIRLQLSAPVSTLEGLSYLSHVGRAADWIVNEKGVGMLTFHDVPLCDNCGIDYPDLELRMSSTHMEFEALQYFKTTLRVINKGTAAAEGIHVQQALPPTVAYNGHESSQGNYGYLSGIWKLGTLAPNEEAVLYVSMLAMSEEEVLQHFAQVLRANQDDLDSTPGNAFNQIATEDDEVLLTMQPIQEEKVDLALSMESEQSEYRLFDYVTFNLTLTNEGDKSASDIIVSFPFPTDMAFADALTERGAYNSWNQTWQVETLEAGASIRMQLTLFSLSEEEPKTAFAQILSQKEEDLDSTPGNDDDQTADEDDEAAWTIYPQSRANGGWRLPERTSLHRPFLIHQLYPIPAVDQIHLLLESAEAGPMQLGIYNSQGQLVWQERLQAKRGLQQWQIDIGQLPSGTYFIHLPQGSQKNLPVKFIKQQL